MQAATALRRISTIFVPFDNCFDNVFGVILIISGRVGRLSMLYYYQQNCPYCTYVKDLG